MFMRSCKKVGAGRTGCEVLVVIGCWGAVYGSTGRDSPVTNLKGLVTRSSSSDILVMQSPGNERKRGIRRLSDRNTSDQ